MKLTRKLERWKGTNPDAMEDGSKAALVFALKDARQDILTLAGLLAVAAFPRRGTAEESITIDQFASLVQGVLDHSDVVEAIGPLDVAAIDDPDGGKE